MNGIQTQRMKTMDYESTSPANNQNVNHVGNKIIFYIIDLKRAGALTNVANIP